MDLTKFTDQELRAEMTRRANEAQEKINNERRERLATIIANRDALLKLVPHGRTSCSDESPGNGLYSAEYGPRCARCGLLELTELDWERFDAVVTLQITQI